MSDPSRTARIRVGDRTRDRRNAPLPVVTWRALGCRHRLMRVFLTPSGWHLLTDGFRVNPEEWLRRIGAVDATGNPETLEDGTEVSLAARDDGRLAFFNLREVAGLDKILSLDIDDWPQVRFEVGCNCGAALFRLSEVAEDCRKFRETRRRVQSRKPVGQNI